jgi:glucose/arabinose dehydrogenase
MRRLLVVGAVLMPALVGVSAQAGPTTIRAIMVVEETDENSRIVAFTFLQDGRIVYGDQATGKIRFFDPSTGQKVQFFQVSNIHYDPPLGSSGLLGLAVHPAFPTQPYIYAYATRKVGIEPPYNQIIRITHSGGVGTDPLTIWKEEPERPAEPHGNGGRILFGPDQRLYAVVGTELAGHAQDLTNDHGKIHRMTDSGDVPLDNPIVGSTIWSYGHRNSFGFAFDPLGPSGGNLWESENGPDCNDEINRIGRGKNYGWGPTSEANECTEPPPPPINTNQDGPEPVYPVTWWEDTVSPVGMTFCLGCDLSDSEGTLFVGKSNTATIDRAVLTANRRDILSLTQIYQHDAFSVFSIESAPDGSIHFNDFSHIYKLVEE